MSNINEVALAALQRLALATARPLAVAVFVVAVVPFSGVALAHNSEQKARLTPGAVVGGPGDKGARGRAEIKSSAEIDTLCYKLWFSGLRPATSAHIHQAVAGQNGEVTVTLFESKRKDGRARGCIHNVDESTLESTEFRGPRARR